MYIEVFLLDNLLMNLLILRLAAAMLSVRLSLLRSLPIALVGAAAAALGAAGFRLVLSLPAKLLITALMAFALPARGLRRRLITIPALLLSAAMAGGAVMLAALLFGGRVYGGTVYGGLPLRIALIGAAVVALLPRSMRKMLSRRIASACDVRLTVEFACGKTVECAALVDTGNLAVEPLTARPVVVLNKKKYAVLAKTASIPIPVKTAAGSGLIMAVRPKRLFVNGVSVDALVAFSDSRLALVPPCVISEWGESKAGRLHPARRKRRANINNNRGGNQIA